MLANVATGEETQGHAAGMDRPRGLVRAIRHSLRFDGSRAPWLRRRTHGTVASVVVSPEDYRLQAGTWVRSGSGVVNQESVSGGREATLYGKVDSTALGASASTGLRLVVSRGSSSTAIPGALTFMWAPTAAPTSSAASSPAASAVSSPALPSRRQAAQALAVLLAQSGTDRAAVTQAVGAVADCSAGLSQDEAIFSNAASSHQALLGKLAALA